MSENKIEVLIQSFFDGKAFNQAQQASRRLSETFQNMNTPVARLNSAFAGKDLFGNMAADAKQMQGMRLDDAYLKKFGTSLDGLAKVSDTTRTAIMKDMSMGGHDKFVNDVMGSRKQLKALGMDASRVRAKFQMEFLGVMFFGMMLKKTFESVAKSTVSSYMKMTEGATQGAQAVTALQVSFELLKFSIGEAIAGVIDSLLPTIIPIIMAITDWIQQHEKLAGWLIITGIILGTLLYIVGQGVLGFSSLAQAVSKIVGLFSSTATEATAAGTATSMSFAAIFGWILLIIAIVAVLYAMWVTNFGGIKDYTLGTLGIMWELISVVFKGIWDIIKTVLDLIVAIFSGDWNQVWELTKKLGNQLFVLFLKILAGIVLIVYNGLMLLYNTIMAVIKIIIKLFIWLAYEAETIFLDMAEKIVNFFLQPLNAVIGIVNDAIRSMSKIPGMGWLSKYTIPKLTTQNTAAFFDTMRNGLTDLKNMADTGVDSFFTKITAGYANADTFKAVNAFIDENNQYAKEIEAMKGPALDAKATNSNDAVSAQIAAITNNLAALKSQTAVANDASKSVTQQNATEASSWSAKNSELEKYMSNLKEYQAMTTKMSGTNGQIDLSKEVPNFALRNTVG